MLEEWLSIDVLAELFLDARKFRSLRMIAKDSDKFTARLNTLHLLVNPDPFAQFELNLEQLSLDIAISKMLLSLPQKLNEYDTREAVLL